MWPFTSFPTDVICRKRTCREEGLKLASKYDAAEHDKYLKATASEIVNRIETGEWTALQVLQAYMARAAQAQATTNCLTEVMFATAIIQATRLDEEFAQTGKLRGSLHGVPVSLKDQFDVIGYDSTLGFTKWADRPASKNADVVELLLAAGAIPFVKTNVPQTLLSFECSNPLWGRTSNPYSQNYTSGGSSGGEGALLALDGSALGFGTDVGGSLRIPASYCGIYSFKPGHGRIPFGGVTSTFGGNKAIRTVAGPIGRSVKDLVTALKVLSGGAGVDPEVAPLPYREVKLPIKLKFGYYIDDKFVKASPANARAVLETIAALRRQGHECVELNWPFGSEPVRLFGGLQGADGYRTLFSGLGSDPREDALCLLASMPRLPRWFRASLSWIFTHIIGDAQFGTLLAGTGAKSSYSAFKLTEQRDAMEIQLQTEIWDKHNLDGIIAPVQPVPCVPHHRSWDLISLSNAVMQYNLVDSPVGVIPVTRVDPDKDFLPQGFWSSSKSHSLTVSKGCERIYDVHKMAGLPIGVQVVGRKWDDEKVLAMMEVIDSALGERGFGPQACSNNTAV